MTELILLDSSNWKEFFNSELVYVMFSKSDCEHCSILELELKSSDLFQEISMCKVVLDDPGLAEMKMKYSWIPNIDILPFNAVLSNGKLIEYWSGNGLNRLNNRLKKHI